MGHDEYVAHVRERFSDLFDPSNSEDDWRYLITIGPGWWPLFSDFCEQLEQGLRSHGGTGRWYIRQTKEKMGELRIYVRPAGRVDHIDSPEPSATQEMISDIREQIVGQANHTCEECGEPGGLRVLDGWYKTCCDQHFLEWQERMTSK